MIKTQKLQRLTSRALLVSLMGLLSAPGNVAGYFDGLPLAGIHEMLAVVILIAAACSANYNNFVSQIISRMPRFVLGSLLVIIVVAIPAKSMTKQSVPGNGHFDACYHSYVRSDDMEVPECEPFFSSHFEGGRSRLDKQIDFVGANYPRRDINVVGSNWNLAFVNNEQFLGRYGNYEQVRHPFRANWVGEIQSDLDDAFIPVTYVGYGSIRVGGQITQIPSNYGVPKTIWIPVGRGVHDVALDYSFTSLQMKPVNGVDYSSYGYYATLRVGAPQQKSISRPDVLIGWAVDPLSFQRFDKIVHIRFDGKRQEFMPQDFRGDVVAYLEKKISNPYIGFVVTDAPPDIGSRVVGISAEGKRHVLLRGDGTSWIEEPSIADGKLWFRIDDSFDSGDAYGALTAKDPRPGVVMLIRAVDSVVALLLFAVVSALAVSLRRYWAAFALLMFGILIHRFVLSGSPGWGYDNVEGSATVYFSALIVLIVLTYSVFLRPGSFLSAGVLGSMYIAVDRIVGINPGMRFDYFLPVSGNTPASNLGAIFYRPGATDWLIHASNTRSALFRGLLFGNEPVFYLQPGYRYFAPIFHYLFGDGDVRIAIAVLLLILLGFVLIINLLVRTAKSLLEKILAMSLSVFAVLFAVSWVIGFFVLVQTTEIPTWPFMLIGAFAALRFGNHRFACVIPGVFLGLAVCMRPNQIIGHFFLLFALGFLAFEGHGLIKFVMYQTKLFSSMVAVSLLPLVHNLYYGNRFVIFSTSRAGGSFDLSSLSDHVLRYLYVFIRPLRTADLTSQGIMGLPGNSGWSTVLFTALIILFSSWVIVAVYSMFVTRLQIRTVAVVLIPFAYLFPIIPYHAYFPRHAIVFWLSILVSTVALHKILNADFGRNRSVPFLRDLGVQ
jgi:hypothetical protein